MTRQFAIAFFLLATPLAAQLFRPAAPAAGQPASRPATRAALPEFVARCVADLADGDGAVRDAARAKLMELRRGDLPTLRAAAADARPLLPAQATVLREVAAQAYLSGDPYESDNSTGFLGVQFRESVVPDGLGPKAPPAGERAVIVESRLPGFCGYRALQDGDVVLDIAEQPVGAPRMPFSFRQAIMQAKPGETLTFQVLRGGELVRVPVKLDARPTDTQGDMQIEEFVRRRGEDFDKYWRETFAPIVAPPPATRPR